MTTTNKPNKILTILKVIISIYLLICVAAIGAWVYLKYFAPKRFTNSAIYANFVEDENGKKPVMEINSYNNLFELKFNYYTDFNSTDVISAGVQILDFNNLKSDLYMGGDLLHQEYTFSYIFGSKGKDNFNSKRLCIYEESDGLSYATINKEYEEYGCIKIEIDGSSYALQLGRDIYVKNYAFGLSSKQKSSLSLLLKQMFEVYHNGTYKSGTYELTFPFKDYFDVYKFDGKKYEKIESDIFDTYIYTKFTNYNEDAKTAKDSIFGQVQYNSNWTSGTQDNLLNEHFRDKNYFILTEQNCKFTFDESQAKHFADINDTSFNEFKDKTQNYTIVFDLDYLEDVGVIFGGVNKNGHVKDLNITSYFTLKNGVLTEVQL